MSASPAGGPYPSIESLVVLAQQLRRTHEQVASTMDRLADHAEPEAQRRRRELAERSRGFAQLEARHVSEWTGRVQRPN